MNLRQLEAFRAVMVAGSMVGAAHMLRVSQPAVSQLIRQFERQSGIQLFQRRNGRIFPTSEASILFGESERVYAGVKKIERVAEGLRFNRYGTLRIAGFPAISRQVLPQIIAGYCKDKPEVNVSLDSVQSRNVSDLIVRQDADLALSVLPSDRDEVEAVHIGTLQALCVVPQSHRLAGSARISAKDLGGEPFISLGRNDQSRLAIDKAFESLGVVRRLHIETTQSDTACSFVAEGCGISIVDQLTMSWYKDERIVAIPFEPSISFKVWLFRARLSKQSRLLEDFSSFLQIQIAANFGSRVASGTQ
ncbi:MULTISPECIES: LysR substrate-binding domain-containing protein [unclassified Mesorhizobium]|uniref:LysR substrate-binding domain-containing protein n=1 Tax=unclassified Mesorhizobium TaxID=325217 RepID=UPI00112CB388|nr:MULTISPECIES: LysR substrate-binding domain-containing protein [unclassified Mesorhizobium]TPM07395.1 LysR family transcriptional regulator [Mesorhizobium sp. B2-3-8]TPM16105.1 LysR family transcriptional regulator [Mesorhizobium sp. B2-3-7]